MALDAGTRIGPYEITAPLGAGGMGEVYRAADSNLKRDVAIKVLPEGFAQDPERLARFEREAQVLASLNHRNIASIYGLEQSEGHRCLVLELIEGEGLDQVIAAGPLPVRRAAPLALQIAEALEAAHEKGIVHRDLKPANVKVTPDGTVKVLDFGLAKAFTGDSDVGAASASLSPTLTAMATQAGVLMGTAAYMSPEQAAAQPADRRADVWAFGVVLLEMLTGSRPFEGETLSHTLASVLKEEPSWERLPKDLPPRLVELLHSCLRKKPRERLQAIGDARRLLEEYVADPEAFERAPEPEAAQASAAPWMRRLPWGLAGVLALALAGTLWALWPRPAPQAAPVRLEIPTGDGQFVMRGYGSNTILSPDGSQVAYVFGDSTQRQIMLRSLDAFEGRVLVKEGSPYHPFFSPNGDWLGYVTRTEMNKVPVRGGSPIKVCDVALSRGATWLADGTIVLAPNPSSGLFRVSAAGGTPEPLTQLDEARKETSHRWPQALPGGRAVLFTSRTDDGASFDDARIELLDLGTGERQVLYEGGSYGRYVASGHVLYVNHGTLFAFPFDLDTRTVLGSAAPVVEGVSSNDTQGGAQYSVSESGTLLYAPRSEGSAGTTLVWADRTGKFTPLWDSAQQYETPSVSPDGKYVAVAVDAEGNEDIWVYDLERDVPTRLTFGSGNEYAPVWSPDSQRIFYVASGEDGGSLRQVVADGSGEPEVILEDKVSPVPSSISPDGKRLLFDKFPGSVGELWVLDLEAGKAEEFVVNNFINYGARFSPDGRWIVYGSNESGDWEVYVRPADGGRGRWQISTGGAYPLWSPDGRTIYYRTLPAGDMIAVDIEASGDALRIGRPETLFSGPFLVTEDGSNRYAVGADGQRFLMLHDMGDTCEKHEHLHVVLHWFTELDRIFSPSSPR